MACVQYHVKYIEQASKELGDIKEQQKILKLAPSFSSSLLLCKKSLTEVYIHFLLFLIIPVLGWLSVWQDLLLCIVWTLNIQQELLWNTVFRGWHWLPVSVFFMTRLFEVLVGFSKWSLERKIRAAVDSSWHPPPSKLHLYAWVTVPSDRLVSHFYFFHLVCFDSIRWESSLVWVIWFVQQVKPG